MIRSIALLLGLCTLGNAEDPSTYFGGTGEGSYFTWLETVSYSKTAFLESTTEEGNGVALHWTIDGDSIQLAVAANATGWVGFGLGESGSMLGADIIMYTAATNKLVDSHVLDVAGMPIEDDCQSWTLVNSKADDQFIIFEAKRLLDTGDAQDRVIIDDSSSIMSATRVLAAWGDESEPTGHGPSNAKGAIRFFGNSSASDAIIAFANAMKEEAEGNFTIQANGFTIPTNRTIYQNFCLSREEILAMNVDLDQGLHIIGIEPFIDPITKPFVHHYILAASAVPWNSTLNCDEYPSLETVYGWAPGNLPFTLPSNVGGPLGLDGFQSFQLEIHYDNPNGVENMSDNSGVRLYFTSKKRDYDMGVFATGDPGIAFDGVEVSTNRGLAQHVFNCDGACSATFVQSEPVTVFREALHMHRSGVSMVNTHVRDEQVIREAKAEYWDFKQQGSLVVPQPSFEIRSGDSFITTCNFNAVNNEKWGLGSENEMCIAYLFYYPRKVVPTDFGDVPFLCGAGFEDFSPSCVANHSMTPDFTEFDQLNRAFGSPVSSCPGASNGSGNGGSNGGTPPKSSAYKGKPLSIAVVSLLFISIAVTSF